MAALTPSIDRKRTALMASPMSPGICFATYLTAVAEGAAWATTEREAAERLATTGAEATDERRPEEMAARGAAATAAARAGAAAAARAPRTAAQGLVMETVVCMFWDTDDRGRGSFRTERETKIKVVARKSTAAKRKKKRNFPTLSSSHR